MEPQWLPQKPVRRVETQHSASFFSAVGFRAAIGGILSVFWWKVTPMHFACFFAAQSIASKPPAVTLFTVANLSKSTRPQRPLAIGGARRKSPGGDVSSFRSVSQIMFGWIMMNDSRYTSICNSNRFDLVMSFAKLFEVGWGCSHPNLPSNIYKYLIGIPNGFHCRPILFPTSSRFSATVPPRESLAWLLYQTLILMVVGGVHLTRNTYFFRPGTLRVWPSTLGFWRNEESDLGWSSWVKVFSNLDVIGAKVKNCLPKLSKCIPNKSVSWTLVACHCASWLKSNQGPGISQASPLGAPPKMSLETMLSGLSWMKYVWKNNKKYWPVGSFGFVDSILYFNSNFKIMKYIKIYKKG